jgi:hypothetical protein
MAELTEQSRATTHDPKRMGKEMASGPRVMFMKSPFISRIAVQSEILNRRGITDNGKLDTG